MSDYEGTNEFEQSDSGVSMTYPMQASDLRKNGYVVIKGRPCRIVEISTSKGKHGHNKVHVIAIDIFTGKKLEESCPSTHDMDVPNVSRKEYQLLYVDEGLLNLIGGDNTSNSGIKLPEGELGDKIQEYDSAGVEVLITVVSAMGEEQAVSCKEASK